MCCVLKGESKWRIKKTTKKQKLEHEGKIAAYDIVPDTLPCTQLVIMLNSKIFVYFILWATMASTSANMKMKKMNNPWFRFMFCFFFLHGECILTNSCHTKPNQMQEAGRMKERKIKEMTNNKKKKSKAIIQKSSNGHANENTCTVIIIEKLKKKCGFRHCA